MKKIGILGGTFDPPHVGHLLIANEVCKALSLDEIWFMPNEQPPHKEKSCGVSNEDRVRMLQLCIDGNPTYRIETMELDRPGRSYTFDTMNILTDKYPAHAFYFIIGADMIEYLPKWYKITQLVKLVTFVGVNRPNYKNETAYPVTLVHVEDIDASSSDIRERLRLGRTVAHLLPEKVSTYIKENELYGS